MNNPADNFQQVMDALIDMTSPFPPAYLHRFSDITPEDLSLLNRTWKNIPAERKISVLHDLEEIAESDTLVCFDDFAQFVLKYEKDPQVLAAAIKLLWECEDPKLIPTFLKLLSHPDGILRAAAAEILGLFIYLGELEEIQNDQQKKIEDTLLEIASTDPEVTVRRKALESLGYSPRKEATKLILDTYNKKEPSWQASALFAMGRSADLRWNKFVLANIRNDNPEIQVEAVRAAGLLELADARPTLLNLLKQPFDLDVDIRLAAIWSLSQIGGKNVRKTIDSILKETEDDDEVLFIENALENLEFTNSFPDLNMMSIELDEPDGEDDFSSYFSEEVVEEEEEEEEYDFYDEDDEDEVEDEVEDKVEDIDDEDDI